MKKSVIKRRKRVIPTAQEGQGDDYSSSGEQGVSPPPGAPASLASRSDSHPGEDVDMERGTVNSDGSVNLGLRRRADHALTLVPEPVLRQNHQQQQPSPRLASDLNQYHSSSSSHQQQQQQPQHTHHHSTSQRMDISGSLNDDNRLPPLSSLASMGPIERQPSLSPASFLSPSRKRSFSSSENDFGGPSSHNDGKAHYGSIGGGSAAGGSNNNSSEASSKRMSSIKSILNAPAYDNDDNSLGSMAGPYPGIGGGMTSHPQAAAGTETRRNGSQDNRLEKRAALQREAERMRQMLADKERELAELD